MTKEKDEGGWIKGERTQKAMAGAGWKRTGVNSRAPSLRSRVAASLQVLKRFVAQDIQMAPCN